MHNIFRFPTLTKTYSDPAPNILELTCDLDGAVETVRVPLDVCAKLTAATITLGRHILGEKNTDPDKTMDALARAAALTCNDGALFLSMREQLDAKTRDSMLTGIGVLGLFMGICQHLEGKDPGWGESVLAGQDGLDRFLSYWSRVPSPMLDGDLGNYMGGISMRMSSLKKILESDNEYDVVHLANYAQRAVELANSLVLGEVKYVSVHSAFVPGENTTIH
ncbi:MAG: hypothetical protein E6Q76_05375 [Rhizobium sp.]|nr:MAG: hypothetical protein E6Q76_05375 [Rhizobium sp.]